MFEEWALSGFRMILKLAVRAGVAVPYYWKSD
jgi:hypothetical protein